MTGVQSKICHCEERSDAAIRIPLCAMRNAEKKRTDSHVGAAPLLGMTEERRTERSQKLCHCEERSDAAIRIPLSAVWDREKENGFPPRANALLGMTEEK